MGMFKSMKAKQNAAFGAGGGNYLRPGKYLLRVDRVFVKEADDGSGKKRFIVEAEVVEILKKLEGSNQQNEKASFIRNLPGPFNYGLGDATRFAAAGYSYLAAVQGDAPCSLDEITDELMDDMINTNPDEGPTDLFVGIYLIADAYNKVTDQGGNFTLVDWYVPENAAELAAA